MSLLRRRMMMQSAAKGFEYVYDPTRGGTPFDDGWSNVEWMVSFSNADGLFTVNINHGGGTAYVYLPDHEQAENCSLEIEASYNNTTIQATLCDGTVYAQASLSKWNNGKFICFPTNTTGGGTPSQSVSADTFYTVKVEKRGGKCSFYLDDVPVAENVNCKPISEMTAYPTDGRTSIRFTHAGSWGAGDRGVAKVRKIIYKEW